MKKKPKYDPILLEMIKKYSPELDELKKQDPIIDAELYRKIGRLFQHWIAEDLMEGNKSKK